MPALGKVLAVMAVALPVVGVSSLLYHRAAGDCTWREALGKTYSVLNNCPGSTVESERGPAADLVLHMVYICGLLTFAVLLGIVTDDIGTQVDKVRRGNHPVVEAGHTVIFNWSPQTLPVLKQMSKARTESQGRLFSRPVVVLADADKEAMDDEIAEELEGFDLKVITRTGNPARPSEQRRASAAAADTVVVLWPSGLPPAEASAQQAAVLAALKTAGGIHGQKVVVQSVGQELGDYDAAQIAVDLARSTACSDGIASLSTAGSERLDQIMAQVANQPGLEDVFADLLEFEDRASEDPGAELYMQPCPDGLEGKPYRDVRRSYDRSTLVGWVGGGGGSSAVRLNPPDSAAVPAGSKLVFVAGSDSSQVPLDQPYTVSPPPLGGRRGSQLPRRNTVVLCFDAAAAPGALQSLLEFSKRGSTITLVCESPDLEALGAIGRRGIKVRVVDGNPSSRSVLTQRARVQDADTVVLSGLYGKDVASSDMQVVGTVLQLQSIATEAKGRRRPIAVVATLNSHAAEDVLWHTTLSQLSELRAAAGAAARAAGPPRRRGRAAAAWDADAAAAAAAAAVVPPLSLHLLRPDELMAGTLCQAACSPQLAAVFQELFALDAGHELYLRDPRRCYGLPLDEPLVWKDVAEVVRRRGETAVGFTSAAGSGEPGGLASHQSDVHLGMPAEHRLTLKQGSSIVVLAEN